MQRPQTIVDRSNAAYLVAAVAIASVFAYLSLLAIDVPGLYMDAVDPDYDIVKLLNPNAPVSEWLPPGNLLFDRLPVLSGPYSGSYPVYWGALFYALFQGSVLSVRVAHLSIGIIILLLVGLLVRRCTKSTPIALVATLVLACDPAFIFVFRTQAYMQMMGLVFFLAALLLLARDSSARNYFIAGILCGLAALGYFVFFFTWPAVVLFAILDRGSETAAKKTGAVLGGFIVGSLPYVLGYGLVFNALGYAGALNWFHAFFGAIAPNSGQVSYFDRVASVFQQLGLVFSNNWQWLTFFGRLHSDFGQTIKCVALVALPLLALVFLRGAPEARATYVRVALALGSFVAVATVFGGRLGGHEYPELLPLAYVLGAVSIAIVVGSFPKRRRIVVGAASLCALVVLVANAGSTVGEAGTLASEGSKGLFSTIVSTYPQAALAGAGATPYIFWSWGEMMPFIYETQGRIPAFDSGQLKIAACQFGHADVVFLGDDTPEKNTGGPFPKDAFTITRSDEQRDPKSGFLVHTLSVRPTHPSVTCATGAVATVPGRTGIRMVSEIDAPGVRFASSPQSVVGPKAAGLLQITVSWHAPGARQIEIHMGSPDGTLFTSGTATGSSVTGPWVQPGVVFFLQDTSANEPGKTLAKMTVSACEKCNG